MESLVGIIRENKIHRFASELQHTNDPVRKHIIQYIINNNLEKKTSNDEMNDYLNKVDKMQYLKQFNRLKPFQKENRIKLFISSKFNTDSRLTDTLYDQLSKLLAANQIKPSDIHYDTDKGIITEIDKITFVNNILSINKNIDTPIIEQPVSQSKLFEKKNTKSKINDKNNIDINNEKDEIKKDKKKRDVDIKPKKLKTK